MKGVMSKWLFCMAFLAAGCSSNWAVRSEKSDIPLQWPYQPARAKVTYEMTLKGFVPTSSARSVIGAIILGEDSTESGGFSLPVAVTTGRDRRLAVADAGCGCVHLYVPGKGKYFRIAAAGAERLKSPVGLAFDDELNLYVSDSAAGKVFVFGGSGEFLKSFQETGSGPMKRPTGLAYHPGKGLLYVADTVGDRILAFDKKGEAAFSFGQKGEGAGQFNRPTHISWSPSGLLYVTDSMNFRIATFDDSGKALGSFGHHGDGSGDLAMPKGVAADRDGIVYVVDGLFDHLQLFNRQGDFLLTVGRRGTDFGEFWLPSGIFIDAENTLYVCDTYNRSVQVFRVTEQYAGGN
jgi:DNA-binding beta-propeller fold protein YncE